MSGTRVFCQLTPAGRSAIATTWIRGQDLVNELETLFLTEMKSPATLKLMRPVYGYWHDSCESAGEGLVTTLLSEQAAEIHSHGGSIAPRMIASSLEKRGYQRIDQHEWTNTLWGGWIAESYRALINAPTRKTALRLLRQYQQTETQIQTWKTRIVEDASLCVAQIRQALSYAEFGRHLVSPWSVVICGQPNVGKSSMINAISGFERSIVHDTPGTTRDAVSQTTALNGWPVDLTDTAGIRETDDEIEQQGIARAEQILHTADLKVALFDSSRPWAKSDEQLMERVQPDLVVHNKADVSLSSDSRPSGLCVSALTGEGIPELVSNMVGRLIPEEPDPELWIPVTAMQQQALSEVLQLMESRELASAAGRLGELQ